MNTPTSLELAILRTAGWFFLFEQPLTAFELWKWMLQPDRRYTLGEIVGALEQSAWLKDRLVYEDGWIALAKADLSAWISERQCRRQLADRKFRRLRRAARWFSRLRSVEAVFACNSLAWEHTRDNSDVDLVVVASPGAVWSTRLSLVAPAAMVGARPSAGRTQQDPLCFSCFVSTDALSFASLQWPGGDPNLAYWVRSFVPVFDRGDWHGQMQQANAWADAYLPHASARAAHDERRIGQGWSLRVPRSVEVWARRFQQDRFPDVIRSMANLDSRVIVSDALLKFHTVDRRAEYRDRHSALIQTLV